MFWRITSGALVSILIAVLSYLLFQIVETDRTQEAVLRRLHYLEQQSHEVDDDSWTASNEEEFQKRHASEKAVTDRRLDKLEYINERYGRH